MCRNNRRAARYGGMCSPDHMNNRTTGATTGLTAIIGAIQEIKLASHGIDSKAQFGQSQSPRNPQLNSQTQGLERGIAHDYPTAVDEKKQFGQGQENIKFDVLPSYEESTGTRSPREAAHVERDIPFTPVSAQRHAPYEHEFASPLPRSNTQTALLGNLENFRSSLLAYRQGASGSKHDTKRAAKNFVRDLYEQEMAKREAQRGYLECGERKQVRRELKPVKQMLKSAVWDARQERRGR